MKRYLNKSLYYQGDGKIWLPLLVVYLINYLVITLFVEDFFSFELRNSLYYKEQTYYGDIHLIYDIEMWIAMIIFYAVCYFIIVGFFKRKKWSTLLSGPFSKLDIRKRELILMLISFLVYLLTFIIVVFQNVYLNEELVSFISDFNKVLYLDILRVIAISFIGISIVAILDSFFSNVYYFLSSIILLILYTLLLISNFNNIIYNFVYSNRYSYKLIDIIRGYLVGNFIEIENRDIIIISGSIGLIILSLIFIYIAKNLTKNMLVENMNEGIIFELPKKIMKFIISTFLGIVFSSRIANYLNEMYFDYNLVAENLLLLNILIIIIISLVSFYIIKKIENNKKDIYYKI